MLKIIELNEFNTQLAKKYTDAFPEAFPTLQKLLVGPHLFTTSEEEYSLLEPWIQWRTFHTGMSFNDHQVFRLGDKLDKSIKQIPDDLCDAGVKVGSLGAMGIEKRGCEYSFFVPDPWARNCSLGNYWLSKINSVLKQVVADNSSGKITLRSVASLLQIYFRFAQFKHYTKYISLFVSSFGRKWNRALFLDLLLGDIFSSLSQKNNVDVGIVFFNGAAHIQHHYLLNAKLLSDNCGPKNPSWYVKETDDPFHEMLVTYEKILSHILSSRDETVIVTGLSQVPYDRAKFYYRLNLATDFFSDAKIKVDRIDHLMSRDLVLWFKTEQECLIARNTLSKIRCVQDGLLIFGDAECRDKSLFITLTYPNEITEETTALVNKKELFLFKYVTFVALKNGMHHGTGIALGDLDNIIESNNLVAGSIIALQDLGRGIFNYAKTKYAR